MPNYFTQYITQITKFYSYPPPLMRLFFFIIITGQSDHPDIYDSGPPKL